MLFKNYMTKISLMILMICVINLRSYRKILKKDFYKRPVENIGMWMSGGADSSLCAYMICKKIKEENLNINFQVHYQFEE